jgi:cell division protein FtsA
VADTWSTNGFFVLDVGPQEAQALAVVVDAQTAEVRGAAVEAWGTVRSGVLVDLDAARQTIAGLLERVARDSRLRSRQVVASLHGSHLHCARANGTLRLRVPIVVRESHVERLLHTAADIGLPGDREVLHVLPRHFCVDGAYTPCPPVGMRGRTLSVEASVVTASRLALDNLERVVHDAGHVLVDVAAAPLVSAQTALRPEERQRGVVLVDVGPESIDASLYRDGALRALACLGAGTAHVCRDLAYAFRLDAPDAEALARRHGVARVADADPSLHLEWDDTQGRPWRVRQGTLAQVIEPRARELLSLACGALERQEGVRPGDRVVLCGAGARMHGMLALAETVFGVHARLGAAPAEPGAARLAARWPAASPVSLGLVGYAERSGVARTHLERSRWNAALRGMRQIVGTGMTWLGGGLRLRTQDGARQEMLGRTLQ